MRLEVSLFVFLITGQVLRLSIQRGLREFFRFSKGASFPEMIREHLKPDPVPSSKAGTVVERTVPVSIQAGTPSIRELLMPSLPSAED